MVKKINQLIDPFDYGNNFSQVVAFNVQQIRSDYNDYFYHHYWQIDDKKIIASDTYMSSVDNNKHTIHLYKQLDELNTLVLSIIGNTITFNHLYMSVSVQSFTEIYNVTFKPNQQNYLLYLIELLHKIDVKKYQYPIINELNYELLLEILFSKLCRRKKSYKR